MHYFFYFNNIIIIIFVVIIITIHQPRLRCLRLIVKKLPERDDEFYKSIIPEVIIFFMIFIVLVIGNNLTIKLLTLFSISSMLILSIVVPQAVLCTKAVGSKARLAAFGLVQQLATSYVHHLDEKFPKR